LGYDSGKSVVEKQCDFANMMAVVEVVLVAVGAMAVLAQPPILMSEPSLNQSKGEMVDVNVIGTMPVVFVVVCAVTYQNIVNSHCFHCFCVGGEMHNWVYGSSFFVAKGAEHP